MTGYNFISNCFLMRIEKIPLQTVCLKHRPFTNYQFDPDLLPGCVFYY